MNTMPCAKSAGNPCFCRSPSRISLQLSLKVTHFRHLSSSAFFELLMLLGGLMLGVGALLGLVRLVGQLEKLLELRALIVLHVVNSTMSWTRR